MDNSGRKIKVVLAPMEMASFSFSEKKKRYNGQRDGSPGKRK